MEQALWVSMKTLGPKIEVEPRTLKEWVRKRLIPYHRVGRLVRFDMREIDKWMAAKKVQPRGG